jgi:hypothetical protein
VAVAGDAPGPKLQLYTSEPVVPVEISVKVTEFPSQTVVLLTEKSAFNCDRILPGININRNARISPEYLLSENSLFFKKLDNMNGCNSSVMLPVLTLNP